MGQIPTVYIFSLKGRRSSNMDLRKKQNRGISDTMPEDNWKQRYSDLLKHFSLELPLEREKLFPSPVQIL